MKKKAPKKYACDSIEEVREAFDEITSVCAGDTRFMAQALLFIAERVEKLYPTPPPPDKPASKPTAWQKFFSTGMRAGKSPRQIAAEWNERKDSLPPHRRRRGELNL